MNDKKYEEQEVQEHESIQPNLSDEAANIIGTMTPEQLDELLASLSESRPAQNQTNRPNA